MATKEQYDISKSQYDEENATCEAMVITDYINIDN